MTGTPVAPQVTLKDVPPVDVVGVRVRVVPVGGIAKLFETAGSKLKGAPAGPPIAIYHDEVFNPEAVDVEVVFPVRGDAEETLVAVRVAALTHRGPYEQINETYERLMAWVAQRGLRPNGPAREVYLIGPGSGMEPADYVTEVQIPVREDSLGER